MLKLISTNIHSKTLPIIIGTAALSVFRAHSCSTNKMSSKENPIAPTQNNQRLCLVLDAKRLTEYIIPVHRSITNAHGTDFCKSLSDRAKYAIWVKANEVTEEIKWL